MLLMFLIEWKNLTYASVSKWVKVVDFLSKTTIKSSSLLFKRYTMIFEGQLL